MPCLRLLLADVSVRTVPRWGLRLGTPAPRPLILGVGLTRGAAPTYRTRAFPDGPPGTTVSRVGNRDGDTERTARISQAQGIVSVQANCTVNEALLLILTRMKTTGLSLDQMAAAVVRHDIRFDE